MKNLEKGNIPGFSNYYISRTGKLYSKFTGNWRLVKPAMKDKRFYSVGKERERKVNVELLISRYIEGIPRKDILEEFGISVGVLYKILRYNNIKLRK